MCEGVRREETGCKECVLSRSYIGCPNPELPPVNKPVLVCVEDEDNVYFMVARRTDEEDRLSFVYYSPEHGQEFELDNVVDWLPLPYQ